MGGYALEMVTDIKGELSVNYSSDEIDKIFSALNKCLGTDRKAFDYGTIESELKNNDLEDTERIISDLFDYSLIGNYDENGNVSFKYREISGQMVELNTSGSFILHYVLQSYFRKNKS